MLHLLEKCLCFVRCLGHYSQAIYQLLYSNLSYDLKIKEGFSIESIEFGKLFQEEESIEGISAFLENRKAKF